MELRQEHTEQPQKEVPEVPLGTEPKDGPKYRQIMDSKIKEWSAQIEKLRSRARVAETEFKSKYEREIRNLEGKKAVLERKLDRLMKSSDQALGAFRSSMDKAISDFKEAMENTLSRFKRNS
ncbi:MAG: hypothetical protein AB1512_22230 [Thermodesulfobacteriota bacterium]